MAAANIPGMLISP